MRSRRAPITALALGALLVTPACGGGGGGSGSGGKAAPSTAPSAVHGPTVGVDPCGPETRSAAASRLFAADGPVEAEIREDTGVTRDEAGFPPADTDSRADPATTLSATAPLARRLLDVPGWAAGATGRVGAFAGADCAATSTTTLTGVVGELDALRHADTDGNDRGRQPVVDLDADLSPTAPLAEAFRTVLAVDTPWPGRPTGIGFAQAEPSIAALTSELAPSTQRALARVVVGMAKADEWRLAAVRGWFEGNVDYAEVARIVASDTLNLQQVRKFDHATMGAAGAALAWAVERLNAEVEAHPLPESLSFRLDTPLGQVLLAGASTADIRRLVAPALVVDQQGDDTYDGVIAGPGTNIGVPLSVLIDVSGNDTYAGAGTAATQGAGQLSFGFLVDDGGNDSYDADHVAQGTGELGVGALVDAGGNDTYHAVQRAQGSADNGVGVAIDLGGDDAWTVTSYGQGYGGVRGAGLLLDRNGNDTYTADDTTLVNPSAQEPDHNTSFAQGASSGLRGGGPGSTLGGGVGLLVDLAGDDRYSCALFCQGAGYAFGTGIVYDRAGNDTYRGRWYAQGTGAHYALGALLDDAGDDNYDVIRRTALGVGNDYSAGFLVDGAGNDHYAVRPISAGVGNNLGYGFFVEAGGDDVYDTAYNDDEPGSSFGRSLVDGGYPKGDAAARSPKGLGFFMDLGGADDYRGAPPLVRNDATWKLSVMGGGPPQHLGLGRDVQLSEAT